MNVSLRQLFSEPKMGFMEPIQPGKYTDDWKSERANERAGKQLNEKPIVKEEWELYAKDTRAITTTLTMRTNEEKRKWNVWETNERVRTVARCMQSTAIQFESNRQPGKTCKADRVRFYSGIFSWKLYKFQRDTHKHYPTNSKKKNSPHTHTHTQ